MLCDQDADVLAWHMGERRDGVHAALPCYDFYGKADCEGGKSAYGCVPKHAAWDYGAWEVAAMCHETCGGCSNTNFTHNAQEAAALKSLYAATGGHQWTHSDGWLSNTTVCWWFGVACNSDGLVAAL